MRTVALLSGLALVLALGIGADPAPNAPSRDPVKLAPDYYKVTLDNDHVRVLDIHLPPGGRSPMHSHPNYIIYMLNDGKARFTAPDGKSTDMDLTAGQTIWRDAESHAVDNIGNADMHVLNIELKSSGLAEAPTTQPIKAAVMNDHIVTPPTQLHWGDAPASLPPGAQMAVLAGDPTAKGQFVVRLKVANDYKIPPHFHPTDENITVISGTFSVGHADKWDMNSTTELPSGGYTFLPAGMHHFAFVKAGTEIQIAGPGPFGITYLNPADDPRRQGK